jgi:lipid II:glycine glycyltransferase (peptidoglycan interpeptide bridge formation enzyme)
MTINNNVQAKRELYRKFLDRYDKLPIYIHDWYLDLVCGKENWGVCIVEKDGPIAALPYCIKKNKLFKWIGMPPLSKLHGPYIMDGGRHQHAIVDELLDQLPKIDFYQQGFNYSFRNWLPFLWRGYSQVTLYSYVFKTLDLSSIFSNMDPNCRRRIKKADAELYVRTDLAFEVFFDLWDKTFKRQGLSNPFKREFLENYYREVKNRSCCQLFFVVDRDDKVHSCALIIWDKTTAYYLMEGSDPDTVDKNAARLLKWKVISYVKEQLGLDRFDFEGSITRSIEKSYREFGPEAEPYYVIKKYNSKIFLGFKFIQNYRQYGKLVQW